MRLFAAMILAASIVCGGLLPAAHAADAMHSLNVWRAHFRLPAYQQDARLQHGAQVIANEMARRQVRGHIGWNRAYNASEGTGRWSIADPHGRRFYACYSASTKFRYAGAATAVTYDRRGRPWTYYVLLVRK